MHDTKKKSIVLLMVFCLVGVMVAGCIDVGTPQKVELKVFHAGSLAVPFGGQGNVTMEKAFEEKYPNVDVRLESAGSVATIRKVTDVGKTADVVAVADYSLIPKLMYPEYTDWHVMFANNKMVLAYTNQSRYANEINQDNWYEILRRPDVKFGFSNPNTDPCGYRSQMVCQLAELHYNDSKIFDDLIANNTAITGRLENNTYIITVPDDISPSQRVSVRDKSVTLVTGLEAGGLNYAFEYQSVAKQHGLMFVELPSQIDLSSVDYADTYKKVQVVQASGEAATGSPIVYGMTVPKNADHPELGLKFVEFVISSEGQDIMESYGQPPIVPAVGSGNVPEELANAVAS